MNTINLTQEQMDNLKEGKPITIQPPTASWEPKGGDYYVTSLGRTREGASQDAYREYGVERLTKDKAKSAAKAMRTFNRLLAYRDEFNPDFKFQVEKFNYYVYQNCLGLWDVKHSSAWNSPTIVYMSWEVAHELKRKLNSGVVVL